MCVTEPCHPLAVVEVKFKLRSEGGKAARCVGCGGVGESSRRVQTLCPQHRQAAERREVAGTPRMRGAWRDLGGLEGHGARAAGRWRPTEAWFSCTHPRSVAKKVMRKDTVVCVLTFVFQVITLAAGEA